MHYVFFDLLRFDRRKGSEANVERDITDADARVRDTLENFRSEVQTGGRRSNGSRGLRINGLITFEVL